METGNRGPVSGKGNIYIALRIQNTYKRDRTTSVGVRDGVYLEHGVATVTGDDRETLKQLIAFVLVTVHIHV